MLKASPYYELFLGDYTPNDFLFKQEDVHVANSAQSVTINLYSEKIFV